MSSPINKRSIGLALRGLAMGAADVIPGVSGGTIAFITGIYEELLETISNLNLGLIKIWRKEGFKAVWKKGNFSFLFALFAGIIISIASLAMLIEYLLEHYAIQLWSFFFGLIIASVWLVGKSVKNWSLKPILGLVLGTIIAYTITVLPAVKDVTALPYIFISGAIAICAMILPGISGSFILLLLGAYSSILGAISGLITSLKDSQWVLVFDHGLLLTVFALGCLVGLISFSRLLNWAFKKEHDIIVAILTGFLIGSLNKIWPWKETLEYYKKHEGEINEELVPLIQRNIFPSKYTELFAQSSELTIGIVLCLFAILGIISLDYFGNRKKGIS